MTTTVDNEKVIEVVNNFIVWDCGIAEESEELYVLVLDKGDVVEKLKSVGYTDSDIRNSIETEENLKGTVLIKSINLVELLRKKKGLNWHFDLEEEKFRLVGREEADRVMAVYKEFYKDYIGEEFDDETI